MKIKIKKPKNLKQLLKEEIFMHEQLLLLENMIDFSGGNAMEEIQKKLSKKFLNILFTKPVYEYRENKIFSSENTDEALVKKEYNKRKKKAQEIINKLFDKNIVYTLIPEDIAPDNPQHDEKRRNKSTNKKKTEIFMWLMKMLEEGMEMFSSAFLKPSEKDEGASTGLEGSEKQPEGYDFLNTFNYNYSDKFLKEMEEKYEEIVKAIYASSTNYKFGGRGEIEKNANNFESFYNDWLPYLKGVEGYEGIRKIGDVGSSINALEDFLYRVGRNEIVIEKIREAEAKKMRKSVQGFFEGKVEGVDRVNINIKGEEKANWEIYTLSSKKASCAAAQVAVEDETLYEKWKKLGRASWCTGNPKHDWFERYYREDNPLIYIIDKKNKRYYQFSYLHEDFGNVNNEQVNEKKFSQINSIIRRSDVYKNYSGIKSWINNNFVENFDTASEEDTKLVKEFIDNSYSDFEESGDLSIIDLSTDFLGTFTRDSRGIKKSIAKSTIESNTKQYEAELQELKKTQKEIVEQVFGYYREILLSGDMSVDQLQDLIGDTKFNDFMESLFDNDISLENLKFLINNNPEGIDRVKKNFIDSSNDSYEHFKYFFGKDIENIGVHTKESHRQKQEGLESFLGTPTEKTIQPSILDQNIKEYFDLVVLEDIKALKSLSEYVGNGYRTSISSKAPEEVYYAIEKLLERDGEIIKFVLNKRDKKDFSSSFLSLGKLYAAISRFLTRSGTKMPKEVVERIYELSRNKENLFWGTESPLVYLIGNKNFRPEMLIEYFENFVPANKRKDSVTAVTVEEVFREKIRNHDILRSFPYSATKSFFINGIYKYLNYDKRRLRSMVDELLPEYITDKDTSSKDLIELIDGLFYNGEGELAISMGMKILRSFYDGVYRTKFADSYAEMSKELPHKKSEYASYIEYFLDKGMLGIENFIEKKKGEKNPTRSKVFVDLLKPKRRGHSILYPILLSGIGLSEESENKKIEYITEYNNFFSIGYSNMHKIGKSQENGKTIEKIYDLTFDIKPDIDRSDYKNEEEYEKDLKTMANMIKRKKKILYLGFIVNKNTPEKIVKEIMKEYGDEPVETVGDRKIPLDFKEAMKQRKEEERKKDLKESKKYFHRWKVLAGIQ